MRSSRYAVLLLGCLNWLAGSNALAQAPAAAPATPAAAPGAPAAVAPAAPGAQPFLTPQAPGQVLPQQLQQPQLQQPGLEGASAPEGAEGTASADEKKAERDRAAEEAAEALVRNEFQQFIEQSTGLRLPIFGGSLFARRSFRPVENLPVMPDYPIAPGDEIRINVWGAIDFQANVVVDRNGQIHLPRIGSFGVAGIAYKDLERHLKAQVGRIYTNFQLTASLGRLHSIPVFVVGHAKRPGSYTVASLSTLVTALFASGGPSPNGSMRNIQLKRANQIVTNFDLYDFVVKGDTTKDARLMPGDVIFIPPVGKLAALSGSVKTPAIFELKGKTTVGELLALAGGLAVTATDKLATVERIEDRRSRVVDEFSLDIAGLARAVTDGDLINIFPISPKFENAVTLRGNVATPLRFAWREGMRVKDLIPEKDALITPDYYLRRNLATRVDLKSPERLRVDIRHQLDEPNWDYAVIERIDEKFLTSELIPFNLGRAVLEGDPAHNLPLKVGDIVTIFSKKDIKVPVSRSSQFVRVEGEVAAAGIYKIEPGETLRQLIARIGGLTSNAYLFGATLTRHELRLLQEKRLHDAVTRMELEAQQYASAVAQGAPTPEDRQASQVQLAAQLGLLQRLRQIQPDGRIVLELDPASGSISDLPDVPLEDGDSIIVPRRPAFVTVLGSVYNQNSFLWRADKRISDYVKQAGGPTKGAEESRTYVIRADGSVVSRTQSGWLSQTFGSEQLMPGDTIFVPEQLEKFSWTKELKDWTQILYQFGLGVAGLKVLRD